MRKRNVKKKTEKRSTSQGKKNFPKIHIKTLLIVFLSLCIVGYITYFFLMSSSVRTSDPTEANGSQYYLLSQTKDSFETTLWVFEKSLGEERKIDKVFVQIFNKEKEKSLLIYIPSWIYSKGLEESFGNAISVSTFKYAGDFIQDGRGVEYSIWQLNQMLGLKSDNYIWFTTEFLSEYKNVYGELSINTDSLKENYEEDVTDDFLYLNNFVNTYSTIDSFFRARKLSSLDGKVYSNLQYPGVLARIANAKKILNARSVVGIDVALPEYSNEELSNSGGMVNYFNSTVFDSVLRGNMSQLIDRELEKERVRVEVYNGSGVSGAARQFGRKIENSGCDVVRYENAPKITESTLVYIVDEEGYENSLKIVDEVLSGTYELIEGRPNFMTTGDIVVVLGEDIKLMYSF